MDSQHCMKQTLSVMDLYEPTPVFVVHVSIIDHFDRLSGTIAAVSRCEEASVRNSVCSVNLTAVDEMMNNKYTTCSLAGENSTEKIDISWSMESCCNQVYQV